MSIYAGFMLIQKYQMLTLWSIFHYQIN